MNVKRESCKEEDIECWTLCHCYYDATTPTIKPVTTLFTGLVGLGVGAAPSWKDMQNNIIDHH